ncbi:DNA repair protein [Babesia ovis]|uniref:DNA mismatch repair protein n=1 Tax=Babesia ovis TaxID=5869 RepID=A0A9W5TDH7_BABOV|nr:DNA repair protein [Babesia ovis]
MQRQITAFFKGRPKPPPCVSSDTPVSSSGVTAPKDVVPTSVINQDVASVSNDSQANESHANDIQVNESQANESQSTDNSCFTNQADIPGINRTQSLQSASSKVDYDDDSPICRKRGLMFDSGFVPDKLKRAELRSDTLGSTLGTSTLLRQSTIASEDLFSACSDITSGIDSDVGSTIVACSSKSEASQSSYKGHDGDIEDLSFVDVNTAESSNTMPELTVGSEPFYSSTSEDCVTDEERKMYLDCPASQKSRYFKAYVEHYYRYNTTFVFPPWLCIKEIRDINGLKPTDEGYDPGTLWVPPRTHRWAIDYRSCHFTECMQQWWHLKQNCFDRLLFFKMGRFYELFYHDACIVQEICGLRWMGSESKPHVGFPEKSLHIYASACVSRGYKVVVVEQTETPQQLEKRNRESGQRQNAVSRAICEIITPGTITRPEMLSTHTKYLLLVTEAVVASAEGPENAISQNNHLIASSGLKPSQLPQCTQSPGDRILSVCSMDASIGTVALGSIDVSLGLGELRALIASLNPAEVVVDSSIIDSLQELYSMRTHLGFELTSFNCSHEFTHENIGNKDVQIAQIDCSEFIAKVGEILGDDMHLYQRLMLLIQRYLKSVMLDNLLNYCTVTILGNDHQKHMVMDSAVLTQLELFKSQEGDVSMSLFGFLNKTSCALGERMLRRWLLKPLVSPRSINERSLTVDFLRNNFSICRGFQEQLSSLPDLERSFGKVLNAAASCYKMAIYFDDGVFLKLFGLHQLLENFLSLQSYVQSFFSEATNLGDECPILLRDMSSMLADVTTPCKDLLSRLELSGSKSCNSAKGVWPVSDKLRNLIATTQSKLHEVLDEIKSQCPSATFVHTKFRYEVEMTENDYRKCTSKLDVTSTRAGYIRVHNQAIISLVSQLEELEFTLTQCELEFFQSVVRQLHNNRGVFNSLLVTASELDCLCSLASVAKNSVIPLVRAEVLERSDKPYMIVHDSVHPIVSQIDPDSFVPNNIYLGHADYHGLILLTGPNMGGKSTLLRQTALCAIMAQIGSFVPATSCKFTVVDRIFTRLGAFDNLIQGKSTFLVEMEDVSSIFHTATINSLVLVDELGRGTSTFDATAIAAACLEKIAAIGCRCIFTTHFQEVCSYSRRLPNVSLCHMAASFDDEQRNLTFLYKLSLGQCPESHGIHVARLAGLPPHVLEMAESVSRGYRCQKRSIRSMLEAMLSAHSRGDEILVRSLYDELLSSHGG